MVTLHVVPIQDWSTDITHDQNQEVITALESGEVIYCPRLIFPLFEPEKNLLNPRLCHRARKHISYDMGQDQLGKLLAPPAQHTSIRHMMHRYATWSTGLMHALFPHYRQVITTGRTSFRPIEIREGRPLSVRKDDRRLHVDAFPSTPMGHRRIIRCFSNINLQGYPRIWRLGEPFSVVANRFLPQLSPPIWGTLSGLKLLKLTRGQRYLYDHYMLQLHHRMKENTAYQREAEQRVVPFPAGSSWIVYTDVVSHAAMSGQHVLEQTFYLPWQKMQTPASAPVSILEKLFKKSLL